MRDRVTCSILVLALMAAVALPAQARDDGEPLTAPETTRVRTYDACLAMLDRNPAAAREAASEWRIFGKGGAPASVCEALALDEMGAHTTAATLLEDLATDKAQALEPVERLELLELAAELYHADGASDRAMMALDMAVAIAPDDPAVRLKRATLYKEAGDYDEAATDLGVVIANAGEEDLAELMARRAGIWRLAGKTGRAWQDARSAVQSDDSSALGWYEMGMVSRISGNRVQAREAFLRAIELDRDGETGEDARLALQQMELGASEPVSSD